ncbi:integral membrane regulator [Streptomyces sp. NPDC020742]|uniref:integral membrane regulator n=1 Tax=unclassified Streptomyces TaxID=2593676 RepID=UPI0033CECEA9
MSDPTRTSQSTRHIGGPAGAAARTPAYAVAPRVRRPLAAAFRLLITAAALTGLLMAARSGPSPARLAASFTGQATLALAVVSAGSARRAWTGRHPLSPRLTGAVLCYVALAALAQHALPVTAFTLPSPGPGATAAQALPHLLLFTLVPLAAVADWLLLTAPRGFRLAHARQWPAYPLLYLCFALTLPAAAGAPAPSLPTALTLALAAFLLPLIAIGTDQLRPAPRRRGNRISPTGISPLK